MRSFGPPGREGRRHRGSIDLRTLGALLALWVLDPVSTAWALGNLTKHITITVGAGVVGGPLASFPVLVDVTNADLRTTPGGSVQNANGYDIVFRGETAAICAPSSSPCMLDHEIELYDGAAGRVVAWVRVPSLANGRAIHMYYGNNQITSSTEATSAVFDADYVGVWHLKESGNGTLNEYRDSSRYGNHGQGGEGAATAVPKQVAGKIGSGQRFDNLVDGDYDLIDVGQDGSLNITGNQITLESWVWHNITPNTAHGCTNPPSPYTSCPAVASVTNPYGIVNHKGYGDGYRLYLHGDPFQCPNPNEGAGGLTAPCLGFAVPGSSDEVSSSQYGSPATDPVTLGVWHHVVGTYDNLEMKMYVDGQKLLARAGQPWIHELYNGTCWAPSSECGSVAPGGTTVTFDTALPAGVGPGDVLTFDRRVAGGTVENFLVTGKPDNLHVTVSPAAAYNHDPANSAYRITSPFKTGNLMPSLSEQHVWIGHGDQPQHVGWSSEFEGVLDEVRISRLARSVGWIQTEYNNQNNPAGFYAVTGPAGAALSPPTLTTYYRSIGTNAAVLYSIGNASVPVNGTVVTFAGGASLPANVGVGDKLDFTGAPAETLLILSRDSATQLTLQTPAVAHTNQTYTIKRSYNSLQAWEDCISLTGPVCPGVFTNSMIDDNRREVGVAYNDGPFTGGAPGVLIFSGSVTDPARNIVLTTSFADRQRGTPGSGVLLNNGGNTSAAISIWDDNVTIERFEITGGSGTGAPGIDFAGLNPANMGVVRDCLIHNTGDDAIELSDADSVVDIYDNFIYGANVGIRVVKDLNTSARVNIFNNTIYDNTTAGVASRDFSGGTGAPVRQTSLRVSLRNNIVHSNPVDLDVARAFTEGYFCTTMAGADPATCTNITTQLGDATVNYQLQFSSATTCLYVGSTTPFRGVSAGLAVGAGGTGNVQWDFWNGAWTSLSSTLPPFTGDDFYWDGFAYWPDDPLGWAPRTVNGGASLYYVRACWSSGTYTTYPTERVIARTDVSVASRYNLSGDKTASYHNVWRGAGVTGQASVPLSGAGGVNFNSATDLHIQSMSIARDAILDVSRQDGGREASALTRLFAVDVDYQGRPPGPDGACVASGVTCWDIGADEYWPTTAVKLQSFSAVPADASVVLEWRTASELDNLGFYLYRSLSESGPWTRLTASLIPGLGSSAVGQAYSYRDAGLTNGTLYFYRLEDVDASSKTTSHGPVSATPVAGAPGGAPGSGPPASSPSGKKKGVLSPSCPDWVVAAYGSLVGASASSAALSCTRHGDPEAVSLGVVSRDSRQATLELKTGGFYALHEPSRKVRVFVPGFDFPQDPQAPALPFRRALVDAVVGRSVRLGGVRALNQVSFPGLVPTALGKAEMQVSRDGTVRAGRRALRDSSPQHVSIDLARLLPSVFQGETKSAVVVLTPLRYDSQRQRIVLAKRVLLKLLFTGRETEESGRGSFGRRERPQKPVTGELLARFYTTSRGLYAVSFDQLFSGRGRALAASQLRLERQGQAQGFHVEPAGDLFGPGSVLYFYADTTAASTDFSSETAWELLRAWDGVPMPLLSAAPAGDAVMTASTGQASFKSNRFYQPGLLEAPELWLWEGLASGMTSAKSLSLAGVNAASSRAAVLEVFLQGASESGNPVDHHMSVSVNGSLAGEAQFAGKTAYRMSLVVPVSLLHEGANELSLTNVADTGVSSYVFLDRFTVAYPQASSLTSGLFEGTWADSGTATVSGTAAALLDVTAAPSWLKGYETTGGSLRFRVEAGHRYLAVSQQALLTPRVAAPAPSGLRSTQNQADYLLIAPRAFLAAAEPLLQRRHDQGLTTRAVAFEEISDEFGHGQPSAEAIKSFLAFAFQSWARPSPRYVLLLGDSSYDPRNFTGMSQPSPLPALWTKTSYLWTVSDPELAAVNGDDEFPDLAIGRLPATTVAEANTLVQKLLAWEDSGQGLSGAALLVADNPDLAGDFDADVDDIAQSFLQGRAVSTLKLSELGGAMRPAILDAMNSGLSLVGYVGHGGAAVWASENVWNSWDAPSLQAQSRQPFLITLNCLNGYFVAPSFNSLAESLLKVEGRGAIASFSPSGLSLDGPAHQYHRALMAELTSGQHQRLGDAVLAAQKAYAQTGLMPELLEVYHLLGDPAMKIHP